MVLYLLFESATGYALFERKENEEIASQTDKFQQSIQSFGNFKGVVSLKAFLPFSSAENALENINDISEGVLNDHLKTFLSSSFPKSKSNTLGVSDEKIGSAISESLGIKCERNTNVTEILRGVRLHFESFIKNLKEGDVEKAQRGLGHSYSRSKVKFNVHRVDNMIIQSISLLDQLDKDLNTFAMRCKEWYSWHFPELIKVVPDQSKYARLVKLIKNKDNLSEDDLPNIEEIVGSAETAKDILEAARSSMGTDISEIDLVNIETFADKVIQLFAYRQQLHTYLLNKMAVVAPNLSTLVGEQVAARLISHAGSLTNLSKMPASTVQILGAEKALFRALKTKGNTPKYGLIFHSSFIGKAGSKDKGRISRYLANKCSIAARIDSFSETSTTKFGEALKAQVEERLNFYETGTKPRKNVDVMHETLEEVKKDGFFVEGTETPKKEKKREKTPKKDNKRKKDEDEDEEMEEAEEEVKPEKKSKKEKKAKKEKTPSKKEKTPSKKDKKEKTPSKKSKKSKNDESD